MFKVVLISTASLFGLAIAAGGTGAVTEMATTTAQLLVALVDALAALARLSNSIEHEIISNGSPVIQALLGAWICARVLLVIIGFAALRMFGRFTRRF